ncbi:MAG: siderophore-interacting protein, partial [Mycetocola sp.]
LRLRLGSAYGDVTRVYTVRSADKAEETIDVDVVRHGETSPMMSWLADLSIGDDLEFVGPRPHFQIPDPQGRPVVLFADDTAIPALYAILQQAPAGLHGEGWIATTDIEAFNELPAVDGLNLHRIAPGTGFGEQLGALAAPENTVVWGAGERDEMREIRSFFRTTCGLAKDDVAVYGYWKRGTSTTDIDGARLKAYEKLLAEGGTVADLDDLTIGI